MWPLHGLNQACRQPDSFKFYSNRKTSEQRTCWMPWGDRCSTQINQSQELVRENKMPIKRTGTQKQVQSTLKPKNTLEKKKTLNKIHGAKTRLSGSCFHIIALIMPLSHRKPTHDTLNWTHIQPGFDPFMRLLSWVNPSVSPLRDYSRVCKCRSIHLTSKPPSTQNYSSSGSSSSTKYSLVSLLCSLVS